MERRTAQSLLLCLAMGATPSWAQSIRTESDIETEGQLVSTVPAGTAPLDVSSTTTVRHLSADFVDGYHGTVLAAMLTALQNQVEALHTAAPACSDDSGNRFVDCDNGTVTDSQTGMVWLANADCLGQASWYNAMLTVSGLADLDCSFSTPDCDCGLSDGSSPGEWRLASYAEWAAFLTGAASCNPTVADDAGDGCWSEACVTAGDCSFYAVEGAAYWTSTTMPTSIDVCGVACALTVFLVPGGVPGFLDKAAFEARFWPVRSGP